jgi:uncharacterized protein (TIGR02246 family)
MTPYFRSLPIAIATVAFSAHAAAGADNTRSEIARQEASWAAAMAAGDIDRLVAMYEDKAWLIVPGGEPFQGRDAIRAALSHLNATTQRVSLSTLSVEKIANGYAIENGVAETVLLDAGAEKQRASYQVLWHKTVQGWKIVRDMVTPLPPANSKLPAPVAVATPMAFGVDECTVPHF